MNSTKTPVNLSVSPEVATQSIRYWNDALRAGKTQFKDLFARYDGFTILPGTLPPGNGNFHVYMGLDSPNDDAKMEFFIVDEEYDNRTDIGNPGVIFRYPARPIKPNPQAHQPIPTDEGVRRILNWTLNNQNWLDALFLQELPMFQSWSVPMEDLANPTHTYNAWFALVVSDGPAQPDLVIEHVGALPTFYDLVRPVPPFKSGAMSEYHLLMEALR